MCCANLADAVVEWKLVSVHVEAAQNRVIERALKCGEHGNLEVANQQRPVRGGFHERGQYEALAHVVVANRALDAGIQKVHRHIVELNLCAEVQGLRKIGEDAVVMREVFAEADDAGVVIRIAGRRDVQRESEVRIGWGEKLHAVGSNAAGKAVDAGVDRKLERVNELVVDGNESVLGDFVFDFQAGSPETSYLIISRMGWCDL